MDDSTGSDNQISASGFSISNDQARTVGWNQQAQDRQAHKDFLKEQRGTGKFAGKYAPQP